MKLSNVDIDNVIRIPTKLGVDFFTKWLVFLSPLHQLTNKEIAVAAQFLTERFELAKVIKDETLLNRAILDKNTKKKVQQAVGLKDTHFTILLTSLRKKGFFKNNIIDYRFIPIMEQSNKCTLMLFFDIKNEV